MNPPAPRFPASWKQAPDRIAPAPAEVFIFATHLDVTAGRLELLRATFSPAEEQRFQSFATDALRSRWGTGRGILREILGRALGCAPSEVKFRYGAHGKPGVTGSPLRFNISHSGALAVIALARAEVGVDVELPRPRRTDAIARRFFTEGEIERLFAQIDPGRRADAFFRLWTCKEAFLKATGEGLSRSTRSYEVAPGLTRISWAKGIPDIAQRYSVHPIDVGDPYRAALVAEAPSATLHLYRWG
jgi:4'-phosphopantetheinyl transferase